MNISLDDVENISKHDEIDDAWVLTNLEYKTSMIYGAKIILLDTILVEQVQLYIEHYRPLISNDNKLANKKRYLFTSSRILPEKPLGTKMDQSAIANAMAASFHKAEVFKNKQERVSCSTIRMPVLTEIVSLGKENMSTIANCFAKHSEKVCKKYYVQNFSERAASRISWDCYIRYKPQADVKKAAKLRSAAIKRSQTPSVRAIKKWIQDIVNRIGLYSNVTVVDDNLMKELNKLDLEQGILLTCKTIIRKQL